MDSREKSRTRTAIAPALPSSTSGRDVLSALAAAWFSSHETPSTDAQDASQGAAPAAPPQAPSLGRASAARTAASASPIVLRRARAL